MGGTYKKKLRAEKAKVKLKGARLPKGLNVTKTEFKVGKIIVPDQLSKASYVEGKKIINIKEILGRLKHHNSNYRLEALRKLREAIVTQHNDLANYLYEVTQNVSALCLDVEREARRESFKTLHYLLEYLTAEKVSPFFHIVSSYLRCAMTHINTAIQDDALLMLDVLLKNTPNLVATDSDKILQNFLEMISRVRSESDRSSRVLTVNMGQKQTSIKWRSKILQRIQDMLSTLVNFKQQEQRKLKNATRISASRCMAKTIVFNSKTQQYFNVKRNLNNKQYCDLSKIFKQSFNDNNSSTTDKLSEKRNELCTIIKHLMPLLLESWLEVRPQQVFNNNSEILLTDDAAATLNIVLDIMVSLWRLVDLNESLRPHSTDNQVDLWFQDQFGEVYVTSFVLSLYPYQKMGVTSEGNSKRAKNNAYKSSHRCIHQNLHIAYLLCRFTFPKLQMVKKFADKFATILQYVESTINNLTCKETSRDYLPVLVMCLKSILLDNGMQLIKFHENSLKSLLRSTLNSWLQHRFHDLNAKVATSILQLFCQIVQHAQLYHCYGGNSEFQQFLTFLPELLLKTTIHDTIIFAMSQLAKQQNHLFLNTLKDKSMIIVKNLPTIKVVSESDSKSELERKKEIINLLYWLDIESNDKTGLEEALCAISKSKSDKNLITYCHYILNL